eukprot:1326212-Amphidinium_carterae.1
MLEQANRRLANQILQNCLLDKIQKKCSPGLDVTSVLSSSMDDLDHDNVNDNESVTSSTGANAAPRL